MISKSEKNCCGCTACENICPVKAITMSYNEKGFLIPVIDKEKCVSCSLCDEICQIDKRKIYGIDNTKPDIYALQKNKGRSNSQSGGAFAAIAEKILSDGGIVYGVVYEKEKVFYSRVDNLAGLYRIKGSKYIQAEVGNIFSQIVSDLSDKKVLIGGTACHIDGLISYLNAKKVDVSNLITCDLICHGVPSPLIFNNYFYYLKSRYKEIKNYNFRNKYFSGWHGHIESFESDSNIILSKNFVNIFYSHLCLRENCYECPYTTVNRITDLTIADFWGIEKIDKSFDDNKGTSLLIASSDNGKRIAELLSDICWMKAFSLEDCIQPNLKAPTEKPELYDEFWNSYFESGFIDSVSKYCNFSDDDFRNIPKIRFFLGKIKRKIKSVLKR